MKGLSLAHRGFTRPKLILALVCVFAARADEGTDFFEKNIRPVLAARCYSCHSAKLKSPQGGLFADTKEGLLKGGKSGAPSIVPGKPEDSLLIKAIQGGPPGSEDASRPATTG